MAQITLPSHIAGELKDLEARAGRLHARGKRSAITAGVGIAGCLVAYLIGWNFGPVEVLTTIDVPSAVTEMFSASSVGELPFQSAASAFSSVLGGTFIKTIAILGMMIGGVAMVMTRNTRLVFPMVMAGGLLLVVPMLNAILGVGPSSSDEESPRTHLVRMAEQKDFNGLKSMLAAENVPELMTTYVLAQAKVAGQDVGKMSTTDKSALKAWVRTLGDGASSGKAGFVKDDVLYALESTVVGKPTSRTAISYLDDRKGIGRMASSAAGIAAATAVVSGLGALGMLSVAMYLRSRIRRIKPHLASNDKVKSPDTASKPDKAAGNPDKGSGTQWRDAWLGETKSDVGASERPAPSQPKVSGHSGLSGQSSQRAAVDETPAGFGFNDVAVMVTAGVVAGALLSDDKCSNEDGGQSDDSGSCGSDSDGGGD